MTLLRHVIAQDVGRALNPALVAGQLLGGVAQGIGWALLEQLAYDGDGQLRTGSFVEYAMPTIDTVPPIDTRDRRGPGARRPVRRQGRRRAAGRRGARRGRQRDRRGDGRRGMRELPMTPLRVWGALNGAVTFAAGPTLLGPLAWRMSGSSWNFGAAVPV